MAATKQNQTIQTYTKHIQKYTKRARVAKTEILKNTPADAQPETRVLNILSVGRRAETRILNIIKIY